MCRNEPSNSGQTGPMVFTSFLPRYVPFQSFEAARKRSSLLFQHLIANSVFAQSPPAPSHHHYHPCRIPAIGFGCSMMYGMWQKGVYGLDEQTRGHKPIECDILVSERFE